MQVKSITIITIENVINAVQIHLNWRKRTGLSVFSACKRRSTCYKGTIFENSPLPSITLIKVIDMWIENVPCDLIASIAGIYRFSIFEICDKLRSLGGLDLYLNKFDKIGGNNAIVEIDESKFGKRKYNRGHRVEGVWVVGAVERINKRIVLRYVEKETALL